MGKKKDHNLLECRIGFPKGREEEDFDADTLTKFGERPRFFLPARKKDESNIEIILCEWEESRENFTIRRSAAAPPRREYRAPHANWDIQCGRNGREEEKARSVYRGERRAGGRKEGTDTAVELKIGRDREAATSNTGRESGESCGEVTDRRGLLTNKFD